MTPADTQWESRVLEVLSEVLGREPDERDQVVTGLCGTDGSLADRVRQLLAVVTDDAGSRSAPGTLGIVPALGGAVAHYRIVRELGRGGQGIVCEAEDERLGRAVALKLLPPLLITAERLDRLMQEARAASRVEHPGIVVVFDVGLTDGFGYIVSELVAGGRTLADLIDEARRGPDLVRGWDRRIAGLIEQVARALHAVHEVGILHRDVKPSNILLAVDGRPKLTDFGTAKLTDEAFTSDVTGGIGTPVYMSPEQASGTALDRRTDVFSLGATLFEGITLSWPFRGDTREEILRRIREQDVVDPRSLRRQVPAELAAICLKAMEHAPASRYATAGELADDLGRFLRNEPIVARPPGPLWRVGKWVARHPLPTVSAALFVIAVVVTVLMVLQSGVLDQQRQSSAANKAAREEAEARAAAIEVRRREALIREGLGEARSVAQRGSWSLARDVLRRIRHEQDVTGWVGLDLLEAETWLGSGRHAEARALVDGLLARPDLGDWRARVLLLHGRLLLERAADDDAIEAAREVLLEAGDEGLDEANGQLVLALLSDRPERVRQLLERVLDADPWHHGAASLLLLHLAFTGSHDDAQLALATYRGRWPEDPFAVQTSGLLAAVSGDVDAGRAALQDMAALSAEQKRLLEGMMLLVSSVRQAFEGSAVGLDAVPLLQLAAGLKSLQQLSKDTQRPEWATRAHPMVTGGWKVFLTRAMPAVCSMNRAAALEELDEAYARHPEAVFLYLRAMASVGPDDQARFFQAAAEAPSIMPWLPPLARRRAARVQAVMITFGHPDKDELRSQVVANVAQLLPAVTDDAVFNDLGEIAAAVQDVSLHRAVAMAWWRQRVAAGLALDDPPASLGTVLLDP